MAADTKKKRNTYDVDETLESPFNIKHLKRSLVYVSRYKFQLFLAFVCSMVNIICNQTTPFFYMLIIDKYIAEKNIRGIVFVCVLALCLVGVSIVCELIRGSISAKTGQQIVKEIRSDLFRHLQELPFDYFDSRPHGKILVRVVNYINTIADFFANGLINILLELLSLGVIAGFMFMTNVKLTFVVLAGMIPFVAYLIVVKNAQRKATRNHSNKNSNINAYYQETIDGMRVTQSFNREAENITIAKKMADACKSALFRYIAITDLMFPFVVIISSVVTVVLYLVGTGSVGLSAGVILAMASYCSRFWQPLQNLGNLYNSMVNTVAYLERIFEAMDEPRDIEDKEGAYVLPSVKGAVRFEDVTFQYEPGRPILEHFSLDVKAGQSIALVGPTGAGKTTVVNLLARFYDIQNGKITIDGHVVSDVTLKSLRQQMGMMLQDTFIFTGTIMENIKYGKLDATDEEAINAAKVVCAHDFIMSMPEGYQTMVNERGSSLSAGQRQLISFARTLLSDPKVLILDEATSNIDTKTELLVQQGLQSLLAGRTSFIIAHRLSTIKNCDVIMYIDNKNIAESGSHEELLEKQGLYYDLYTSQLASKTE